jgi:hypothetical protein
LSNSKSDFLKYGILFCIVTAKSLTSIISILALFTNVDVRQPLFFAFFYEIAVLYFIILPSGTVSQRMNHTLELLKRGARKIELKIAQKKLSLDQMTLEGDELVVVDKDLESSPEDKELQKCLHLNKLSLQLHFTYKYWQAQNITFHLNFTNQDEFNIKFVMSKDTMLTYLQALLFTLVPAFIIKFFK